MNWQSIETAPQDGSDIRLLGSYPRCKGEVSIVGSYDAGGHTEGWVDERGNWFFATHWMPDAV